MKLYAYIDGASRGNPGESGIGIVFKNQSGSTLTTVLGYIGKTTNNIAEYSALLVCLNKASEFKLKSLVIFSDSELLVKQINGQYKVRNLNIKKLFDKVKKVLSKANFKCEITHINREKNKEADLLANAGIDSGVRIKV